MMNEYREAINEKVNSSKDIELLDLILKLLVKEDN